MAKASMLQKSPLAIAVLLGLASCASLPSGDDAVALDETGTSDVDFVASARTTSMGPICWAAILESISQYGLRCGENESQEFRAALDLSLEIMDRRFTEAGWSQERLSSFKVQMGYADEPKERLCGNPDAAEMYRGFQHSKPEDLTGFTEELAKRPGDPEWGTCL